MSDIGTVIDALGRAADLLAKHRAELPAVTVLVYPDGFLDLHVREDDHNRDTRRQAVATLAAALELPAPATTGTGSAYASFGAAGHVWTQP